MQTGLAAAGTDSGASFRPLGKITQAGDELDKLIGTRTNKIMTQLKKVTELPEAASEQILDMAETDGGQYKTAENDE